jgi:hypothetical protein
MCAVAALNFWAQAGLSLNSMASNYSHLLHSLSIASSVHSLCSEEPTLRRQQLPTHTLTETRDTQRNSHRDCCRRASFSALLILNLIDNYGRSSSSQSSGCADSSTIENNIVTSIENQVWSYYHNLTIMYAPISDLSSSKSMLMTRARPAARAVRRLAQNSCCS